LLNKTHNKKYCNKIKTTKIAFHGYNNGIDFWQCSVSSISKMVIYYCRFKPCLLTNYDSIRCTRSMALPLRIFGNSFLSTANLQIT